MKIVEVHSPAGTVSIQWIAPEVGIVRHHERGGFGSPAAFAVTMRCCGDIAEFFSGFAAANGYTRRTHIAMRDAMLALGVSSVRYDRRTPELRHKELRR